MKSKTGLNVLGLALSLTIAGPLLIPVAADAQTQGMERRGGARDTRQDGRKEARTAKQECKKGDNSRAECRQEKRNTKQEARGDARDIRQAR